MKNHTPETGAYFPELPWFHVADGILPPLSDKVKNCSELVRIVTTEDQEGFAELNYEHGWVIKAVINGSQAHMPRIKAWKHIELYSERFQTKPTKKS